MEQYCVEYDHFLSLTFSSHAWSFCTTTYLLLYYEYIIINLWSETLYYRQLLFECNFFFVNYSQELAVALDRCRSGDGEI